MIFFLGEVSAQLMQKHESGLFCFTFNRMLLPFITSQQDPLLWYKFFFGEHYRTCYSCGLSKTPNFTLTKLQGENLH